MSNSIHLSGIRLHWVQVPLHEPFKISNGEVAVKDVSHIPEVFTHMHFSDRVVEKNLK